MSVINTIFCNVSEAKALTKGDSIGDQLELLRFDGSVENAVVTAGADGVYALGNGNVYHVPAYSDGRPVVDDTGAGDAAQTAITHALIEGSSFADAIRIGAIAGFEACTAVGPTTHLLTRSERIEHLHRLGRPTFPCEGVAHGCRLVIGPICMDNQWPVGNTGLTKIPIRSKPKKTPGGDAANSAVGHRLLAPDEEVVLFAHTGQDPDGATLRNVMKSCGIKLPLEPLPDVETSCSQIFSDESGTGTIYTYAGAREVEIPRHVIEEYMPSSKACCIQGHAVNEQLADIIALAGKYEVPVFFGLGRKQIHDLGYEGLREILAQARSRRVFAVAS